MLTTTVTATFIRHYIEMVVVMFAGMIVLGLPGEAALRPSAAVPLSFATTLLPLSSSA